VDSREAVTWVVDQEVGNARPRGRPAARSEPPPGWEVFKTAEAVDDPLEAAAVVTPLWLFYSVPRLTALVAAEFGLSMDQLFKLSGALLFILDELCRQRLEHWPKDPDAVFPVPDAFEPVNWPWLAKRAGEPDWTPPG
jgi:hypothetical protein